MASHGHEAVANDDKILKCRAPFFPIMPNADAVSAVAILQACGFLATPLRVRTLLATAFDVDPETHPAFATPFQLTADAFHEDGTLCLEKDKPIPVSALLAAAATLMSPQSTGLTKGALEATEAMATTLDYPDQVVLLKAIRDGSKAANDSRSALVAASEEMCAAVSKHAANGPGAVAIMEASKDVYKAHDAFAATKNMLTGLVAMYRTTTGAFEAKRNEQLALYGHRSLISKLHDSYVTSGEVASTAVFGFDDDPALLADVKDALGISPDDDGPTSEDVAARVGLLFEKAKATAAHELQRY